MTFTRTPPLPPPRLLKDLVDAPKESPTMYDTTNEGPCAKPLVLGRNLKPDKQALKTQPPET